MSQTPGKLAALRAQSLGELSDGVLRPDESLDAVWEHIARCLELLAESAQAGHALNENGLTQRLVTTLERRPGYRPYFFQKEYMEQELHGGSRRIDVAVQVRDDAAFVLHGRRYAGGDRFLALEAKRLPTPGAGREREYLAGPQGGVERFKRGIHAGELRIVGILGYIQQGSFEHWRDRINRWVDDLMADLSQDLPWDEQDRLQVEEASARVARLHSSNLRVTDDTRLAMRHLWVRMHDQVASAD